ncbi:MAG: NAD kinase [Williamsia herbipolensis]|uniref:NAD kinase n=1 Tax=Williamsia serinedens TaxID=391736 RepID=A0ABT1GX32_9NOCA|nr:NAD kinase [Williamsia serinedens]MBE7161717.1 NAD kinase [Williamsia herbipolensis]MCP2159539.1 NAD+ kinase [Williamsia serinedens]
MTQSGPREFLVVAHTGREIVTDTIAAITRHCVGADIKLRVVEHDISGGYHGQRWIGPTAHPVDPAQLRDMGADVAVASGDEESAAGCELVIVLGGDGTFLRAAELAYPAGIPVLGINLGHIGFLAEAEANRIDEVMALLVAGNYAVEERMTLDITVLDGDTVIGASWAVNEASIQNPTNQGVLEMVTEVDGRPVASYGADGVLVSTPTGSTAYAFSAGGPVMWPDLEAILVVPSNAHALFTRPLVTSPASVIAIEVERSRQHAIVSCDGRRTLEVPAGARIEVVRGAQSLRWVRIDSDPFADRLVTKFDLPVTGWRGRQV